MALNFPANPTIGDEYSAGGFTWTWSGSSWDKIASAAVGIPSGETADRPATPAIGDQFYNGTLGVLELYTNSGWLPATGANDFNVVLTGSETSVTLDKEYFAGAYTITSALSDTTFDLYLFDTANSPAGYTSSPSINATSNFNKVVVYGGTGGDLLSFTYKTTFTTATSTTDTFAAPYVTSISAADLPNLDDSVTITGGNFDTDIQVWFDGQNDYSEQAKSVVYGSSTSIVAVRPDSLLEDDAPYTIRLVNPGIAESAGSNKHKLTNAITAGGDPVWVTSEGLLPGGIVSSAYTTTVQATDPDGAAISYEIVSGQLPTGITLNSSTGEISGTASIAGTQNFTIAAIDSGGNSVNRSFSLSFGIAGGGTVIVSGGYAYHTFTSNGTFLVGSNLNAEVLLIGGGGGGGGSFGGGGGAGGLCYASSLSLSPQSYLIEIGAGGTGGNGGDSKGNTGVNSTAFGITGNGGGGGGAYNNSYTGNPGGSGGGASTSETAGTMTGGASTQTSGATYTGYGNRGGNSFGRTPYIATGGGGSGFPGQDISGGSQAGSGGDGLNTWSDWATATGTGVSGYYAGGGAGASYQYTNGSLPGSPGAGGGGTSTGGNNVPGGPATSNTGSGGGGAGYPAALGGSGGSGIVIVRYAV